jgi:cell division protein FtsB
VARSFAVLVIPAITLTVLMYFGSYLLWGNRGLFALVDAQARLEILQQQLFSLRGQRDALAHRIVLMERGDNDLVEELARTKLMDAAPNQVSILRPDESVYARIAAGELGTSSVARAKAAGRF